MANNHMQQVWTKKWQLLRAANMLLGELSFNEIDPEILKEILNIIGFKNIQWENESSQIIGEDCLEFFNYRFGRLLDSLSNANLIKGLKEEGKMLENNAREADGMEIPIYKMTATKGM